jgi:hypothetical protein
MNSIGIRALLILFLGAVIAALVGYNIRGSSVAKKDVNIESGAGCAAIYLDGSLAVRLTSRSKNIYTIEAFGAAAEVLSASFEVSSPYSTRVSRVVKFGNSSMLVTYDDSGEIINKTDLAMAPPSMPRKSEPTSQP